MTSGGRITAAVEGDLDEAVVRRVVQHVGRELGPVYGKEGKAQLLSRLGAWNHAARLQPWLVLVDLDHSADCAPTFVAATLADPSPGMRFRVAVRMIEAWILADAVRLSAFLGVSEARVPPDPDALPNPKASLLALARRSRRRAVREDLVPRVGSTAKVGPAYSSRLIEFVSDSTSGWDVAAAAGRSASLRRCVEALRGGAEERVVRRGGRGAHDSDH